MITLIIVLPDGRDKIFPNLTLTELGSILVEHGEKYFLCFDSVKAYEPQVGMILYAYAYEKEGT